MELHKKEIIIRGESLLKDVQEAFSACYPFLMIEFYHRNRGLMATTYAKIEPRTRVLPLAGIQTSHTIDISRVRTVSEVLSEISSLTGVTVRMCRKSGNVWNAISLTDGWTLERQNNAGEYISTLMQVPPA